MLGHKEKLLMPGNVDTFFLSPYDWRVVVVQSPFEGEGRGFYMCKGSIGFLSGALAPTHNNDVFVCV
jgi:hypothetical protein